MLLSTQRSRRHNVGILPALAIPTVAQGATVAAGAAIGGLLALVRNKMDDTWTSKSVFQANMRTIHSSMLAIQCVLGGAQLGQPLVDSFGTVICPGGMKPVCAVDSLLLKQWRTLRDGFGAFWADVAANWTGPTDSEAAQAKQYATDFATFYGKLQSICGSQGTNLPSIVEPPPKDEAPAWLRYTVWGAGAVALIAVAVSLKSIFGKAGA